jgi:Fic family protein
VASVKIVKRGSRTYRYLVQSYRWEGIPRKKELYLGAELPEDLTPSRALLERTIWSETWFRQFDLIRAEYQRRLRAVPRSVLEKESEDFVVEFTYDTNRIEGSTLSLEDTRLLLVKGITPSSKPVSDVEETRNHAKLIRRLAKSPEPVDLPRLLRWHRELFGGTKPDIAGRLRDFEVRIGASRHLPPSAVEVRPMLLELLRWTGRSRAKIHPVQLAAEFHFRFENIHPFGDGNGRIGRVAMNMILARQGFPMLNIRYKGRGGYYHALEESSVRADSRPFLHWFFLRYSRANRFFLIRRLPGRR